MSKGENATLAVYIIYDNGVYLKCSNPSLSHVADIKFVKKGAGSGQGAKT